MALERSVSSDKDKGGGVNFRRSMTFKPEEHEDSIGRSLSLVNRSRASTYSVEEKRDTQFGFRLPQKSSSRKHRTSTSEAEIKKLKFRTDLPDRVIRQSLAVFDEFDIDQNGYIEKGEFRDTLNQMGISVNDAQLKRLMELFDENHDEKISKEEFLKMVKKIGLYHQRDDIEENNVELENIMCAFVALGGNSDFTGTVSCARLKDMVNVFDLDLDADALLEMLDDDADGTVDYKEFSALFGTAKTQRNVVQEMIHVIQEDDDDLNSTGS